MCCQDCRLLPEDRVFISEYLLLKTMAVLLRYIRLLTVGLSRPSNERCDWNMLHKHVFTCQDLNISDNGKFWVPSLNRSLGEKKTIQKFLCWFLSDLMAVDCCRHVFKNRQSKNYLATLDDAAFVTIYLPKCYSRIRTLHLWFLCVSRFLWGGVCSLRSKQCAAILWHQRTEDIWEKKVMASSGGQWWRTLCSIKIVGHTY